MAWFDGKLGWDDALFFPAAVTDGAINGVTAGYKGITGGGGGVGGFTPRQQYWGGSEEALNADREQNDKAIKAANRHATSARRDSANASVRSGQAFTRENNRLARWSHDQGNLAERSGASVDQALADYREGRAATLGNAAALEQSADRAEQNYKQTSDAAFRANTDANNRQALAMASRGGAAGLRTALATNTNANAQASAQAEITRAQELNQIQSSREAALVNAANIRAGVGTQDQGVAGLQSNRQQAAYGNQLAASAQKSNNIGTQGGLAAQTAGDRLNAATAERSQYIDQGVSMETAQLNAEREAEQQRLYARQKAYDRDVDPVGFRS